MASSPTTHTISSFVHLYILFLLATTTTAQKWDGVVITQADLQGLQAFKHQLEDPRGVLHTWNGTGLGACSGAWLGIKCVKGQVIAISLPWKGLAGAISNSVGQLRALRKLSLHDNAIAGRIPAALGFLPNLRGVYLFNNRLSGAIPPGIGKSPVLQTLDLSNNSLVGTVPPGIGSSGKILRINLAFNLLVGGLPVGLTRSPSLEFLSVRSNNLSGFIPDTWGGAAVVTTAVAANIPVYQLQTLILDNNAFSGPLPASLGRLPALQVLTFTNNQLNGSIPPELFNATSLTVLDGASNRLDGPLPDAVGNLRNLSVLSLTANNLLGLIPATLGNDTALTKLDLSSNNFSGNIPDSLDRLASLTTFDVSNNTLSGPVPLPLAQNFNASSFRGNLQLCGYALDVPCPPSTTPAAHPSSPAPAPATYRRTRKLSTREIVLIAAGSVLAVLLVLVCVMLCCLIRKRAAAGSREVESGKKSPTAAAARGEKSGTAEGAEAGGGGDAGGKLVHFDGPLAFTADDLLCATAEIMGKSTYGTVYRATLEDGSQAAVKRLREKITKGQKEFELEVSTLGRIRHRNLLALRAYYLGPKGEKLLVFDYMPKGSLTSFLHARAPDTPVDWPTRMRIAIGATRGLLYLHTHCNMVHGNLTSSNILLDNSANPKIADYGLSRLMTAAANSSVIAAAGALGYRAPELSKLKKASTKTDVYSLGVILLELLTGKSPGEAMNGVDLPQWVASIVKEEWTNEVFDLELMRDEAAGGGAGDELLNTLKLALHCVDPSASARPEVQQVLHQLEEIKPELAGEEAAAGTEAATTSTASVGGEGHGAAAGHSKDGA